VAIRAEAMLAKGLQVTLAEESRSYLNRAIEESV
jgi:hypothetical protein